MCVYYIKHFTVYHFLLIFQIIIICTRKVLAYCTWKINTVSGDLRIGLHFTNLHLQMQGFRNKKQLFPKKVF